MQSITILGATGSIGVSTLDVLARHRDKYRVFALTAHSRVDELAAQCAQFRPARAVVGSAAVYVPAGIAVASAGALVAVREKDFAAYCQTKHAVGVSSGTDALLIALIVALLALGAFLVIAVRQILALQGA